MYEGTMFNNIIYGNTTGANQSSPNGSDPNGSNISFFGDPNFWGYLRQDYNNIQNSSLGLLNGDLSWGPNTYDLEPGFSSPSNYSLSDGSTMIGLGVSSYAGIDAPTFDYLNKSRPNPVGSNPDLGAYENALAVSPYPLPGVKLGGGPSRGEVSLSWDISNETDIAKYHIYMSTVQNFPLSSENFVDETLANSYMVTNLINKTDHEGS